MNTSLIFRIILIIILLIIPCSLFSQDIESSTESEPVFILDQETPGETETTEDDGNLVPIWEFVRMLIILGCVIGVIYLFFFFLKKGMKKKMPKNDLVKVITTTPLQGNDVVYLIQIGLQYFLVGSGGGGLSLISQITDKETIDSIMLKVTEETPIGKQSFSDILLKIFNPGKKQNGLISNPINFMKKQQERLNKFR